MISNHTVRHIPISDLDGEVARLEELIQHSNNHLHSAFLTLGLYLGLSSTQLLRILRLATSEHITFWVRDLARRVDYTTAPDCVRAILDGEIR